MCVNWNWTVTINLFKPAINTRQALVQCNEIMCSGSSTCLGKQQMYMNTAFLTTVSPDSLKSPVTESFVCEANSKSSVLSYKFGIKCDTCRCLSVCGSIIVAACLLLRASYPPTFSSSLNTLFHLVSPFALLYERRRHFIDGNVSNFTNTVNSNQYRLLFCRPWGNSPDSLQNNSQNWAIFKWRNNTNFVKHRLWQILS